MGWVIGSAPSWREARRVGAGVGGDCLGVRGVVVGCGGGWGVSSPKGFSHLWGEGLPLWAGRVVGVG